MARILSEKSERALRQVIHFVGVQRFGEAHPFKNWKIMSPQIILLSGKTIQSLTLVKKGSCAKKYHDLVLTPRGSSPSCKPMVGTCPKLLPFCR